MTSQLCIACETPLKSHIEGYGGTRHDLWYCPECGTNHTMPLPSADELFQFYQGFMFNVPTGTLAEQREAQIRRNVRSMCKALREEYGLPAENGKILDFGGGVGITASEFGRMGYRADLYDLDTKACTYARDRFSNDLNLVSNDESEIPKDTYDLVYSSQVIEHLLDPIKHFEDLLSKLRAGGIIVMTTPNQQSGEHWFRLSWLHYYLKKAGNVGLPGRLRAFMEQKWLNFDPPRHVYGFNRVSLPLLAHKAGFRELGCFPEYGHRSVFNTPRPLPQWRSGFRPMPLQMFEVFGIRLVAALNPAFLEGNNLVYIGRKP
jgi:SAM-dependent methyltransferase